MSERGIIRIYDDKGGWLCDLFHRHIFDLDVKRYFKEALSDDSYPQPCYGAWGKLGDDGARLMPRHTCYDPIGIECFYVFNFKDKTIEEYSVEFDNQKEIDELLLHADPMLDGDVFDKVDEMTKIDYDSNGMPLYPLKNKKVIYDASKDSSVVTGSMTAKNARIARELLKIARMLCAAGGAAPAR